MKFNNKFELSNFIDEQFEEFCENNKIINLNENIVYKENLHYFQKLITNQLRMSKIKRKELFFQMDDCFDWCIKKEILMWVNTMFSDREQKKILISNLQNIILGIKEKIKNEIMK